MNSSPKGTRPSSSRRRRKTKLVIPIIAVLTGMALLCSIYYLASRGIKGKSLEVKTEDPVAELVSASGLVLMGKAGTTERHQVLVGARLMEGDLVQTDKNGEACIRFVSGNTITIQANTIFTVQSAENASMEISAPVMDDEAIPDYSEPQTGDSEVAADEPDNTAEAASVYAANTNEPAPYIRLDRVIPFGRSLELIGNVDAGSRLVVNDEVVEVTGDGSFKHFTNPFPSSVDKARLILKVTDLAGRTRTVAAIHDFNIRGRSR